MQTFAGSSGGTLVQVECSRAKNIQPLSCCPHEQERLLLPNTMLHVLHAVPRAHVSTLFVHMDACLPANVDLVVTTETARPVGSGL